MTVERITAEQARRRIEANTGADSLVEPASIDWTQPGREAVTIAGLVGFTNDLDQRSRIVACALALVGYEAHLAFEAGRHVDGDAQDVKFIGFNDWVW